MKLEANKIVKSYKSRKVVKGVDLELNQGEIVGLLGPNGAGKTTCFYMIVGLIKCDSGLISINKTDISLEPMYKRAKQ
jgi:lipopolysaccharide export system ATP-binding protein